MRDTSRETCVVIGNGPSLRGFDLHRLRGVRTLGMNAAYRYWDQIGWYPDYYCCLDDQLIQTHHAQIERMYAEGRFKAVFVHGSFFEHHPHRLGHPDFTSFDQVTDYWYGRNGKALGLTPLFEEPAFRLSDKSKITTGSHAVRFAAWLGHTRIALIGIDLKYVEILPEATPTSGIGLKIERTPASNPNYFFDGYQQAGDLYNIPNPQVHDGDLHPRSFERIPVDFEANGVAVEIVNANPKSVLSARDVFRYVPIEQVLGESLLRCVFVPTNQRELNQILSNFALWSTRDYRPSDGPSLTQRPDLVFVFNNADAQPCEAPITAAFHATGMERYFAALRFEYLDLEGERDIYVRDYTAPVGEMGYKAGPNHQFFDSMRLMRKYGGYAFLMETDCLPVRKGWLSQVQRLVDGAEPFWVLGSAYRGRQTLSSSFVRHLNGNAVYAVGDPEFQEFLTEFWEFHTWRLIRDTDKRLAYDCILEIMFSEKSLQVPANVAVWKSCAHKFRYTDYILNTSGARDLEEAVEDEVDRIRVQSPTAYIVHNRALHKMKVARLPASVMAQVPAAVSGTVSGPVSGVTPAATPASPPAPVGAAPIAAAPVAAAPVAAPASAATPAPVATVTPVAAPAPVAAAPASPAVPVATPAPVAAVPVATPAPAAPPAPATVALSATPSATPTATASATPAAEKPHLLGTYSVPTRYRSAETAVLALDHPRLLVLDMTAMGNGTATGEVKSNLLRDWPTARLLQVSSPRPDSLALVRRTADGTYAEAQETPEGVRAAIAGFAPQAILYRPLADRPGLHALAMAVIRSRPDTPLITWIMDDWPARLEATDPAAFAPLDADLRWLLARSGLCLSISDAMSTAFSARYGQKFTAFANGIDAALWSAPRVHRAGPVVLRYAGGLAPDMNAASLQRVARAVEARARAGQAIRFEINTRPHWVKLSGALFDGLTATRIETETRPPEGYVRWLCEADALLIAYNFDAASLRYVRYSMANKLPECLASGAAVLAHGPREVATLARLEGAEVADLVLTEDSAALEAALAHLADPAHRMARGRAARALALAEFELGGLNQRLAHAIASAEVPPQIGSHIASQTGSQTASGTALPATAPTSTGTGTGTGTSHAKSLNGHANSALNGSTPEGPARFYLRTGAGGALARASLSEVAARLQQGSLRPGDLVLAYADPCMLVAQAVTAGQTPEAALAQWIRSVRQHLVVARTAEDLCRFHPLGQPHPDLPAEAVTGGTHPADPLALAAAALAVLQSPDALRFLAELTTGEGDDASTATAALAAGASAQDALAGLAALREAATAAQAASQVASQAAAQASSQASTQANRLRERDMQAAATLAQEQIRQLRATLGVYHADAEALRAELEQIKRSRSWRITEPLRGVRRSVSREVN